MATALAARPRELVDRQRRLIDYLRVSVTDRCNYRCTYCVPASGVGHFDRGDVLSRDEIVRLVGCFARLGVRRVRLTGGEPTVRGDLLELAAMVRAIPGIEELALSTNAHRLAELAGPLRAAGVDRLNISVDSLDPERFARITRGGSLARVQAGIEAARAAGFRSIKINVVAVRGFNDDEIAAICAYAWARDLVPRFIEQMPMADGALYVPGTFLGAREIRALVEAAYPGMRITPVAPSREAGAGPARYFRLEAANEPGGAGAGGSAGEAGGPGSGGDGPRGDSTGPRFGIISAVTEHFCDTCNRVRLAADGALHTCLGYDDATDLRAILRERGEEAVVDAISEAVAGKRDGHSFGLVQIGRLEGGPRQAMVQIGG